MNQLRKLVQWWGKVPVLRAFIADLIGPLLMIGLALFIAFLEE
jgi:hypothetical protein